METTHNKSKISSASKIIIAKSLEQSLKKGQNLLKINSNNHTQTLNIYRNNKRIEKAIEELELL